MNINNFLNANNYLGDFKGAAIWLSTYVWQINTKPNYVDMENWLSARSNRLRGMTWLQIRDWFLFDYTGE